MSCYSCFGYRRRAEDSAQQPLLAQYQHETTREQRLHEKLHTYQMLRALSKGYLPSNEQLIVNLRSLLASDLLNPDQSSVTDSGRLLTRYTKQLLRQLIDVLQHKNFSDEAQDLLWYLKKSRVGLNTSNLSARAAEAKSKANTAVAQQSFQAVGSLLLNNADFRLFLSDLQSVGREVFRDSALSASKVAQEAGHHVDIGRHGPETRDSRVTSPPTKAELADDAVDLAATVREGAKQVSAETQESAMEHLSGSEKRILVRRLQAAILKLRQRSDYTESVSTLTLLLHRCALLYLRAADHVLQTAQDGVETNENVDAAVQTFGALLKNFGDPVDWKNLQRKFETLIQHQQSSAEFERFIGEVSTTVQKMFTDPDVYDNVEQEINRISKASSGPQPHSSLQDDVKGLLRQIHKTFESILEDNDVRGIVGSVYKLLEIVSPPRASFNKDLIHDLINIFGPLITKTIQYIPIPRLELAIPGLDLLLENLVLEPGRTVNHTSFLPFRFRVQSYNNVELRKTLTGTVSETTTLTTIKLDGLSLRATDIGYWLRLRKGIFRFTNEGIATFELDQRGIDIHLDLEIGKDRLEEILSLRAVRVRIHNFTYTLRQNKFACLATLLKPVLKPLIRQTIERQLAKSIANFFHAANRELVFARERLRATRIADPRDLITFFRAVAARLKPPDDPDVYARVGVEQPGQGVFKGLYAPGSLVKLWREEASKATERVEDFERGGWRNDIFDVKGAATVLTTDG